MDSKCTICGESITEDVVAFGEKEVFCGANNYSTICEECNKLSHYEQRKLYLLKCLVDKKPHGYWREVKQLQEALVAISEQLSKNSEIKIYIDGKDISDKILENNSK